MGSRSYGRSIYGGVLRTVGARLWAKPQSQRPRGPGRVGGVPRLLMFDRAAAGPADTAALRPGPLRRRAGLQISHSEKFDNSLGQKGLTCMSQLTLYNGPTGPTDGHYWEGTRKAEG